MRRNIAALRVQGRTSPSRRLADEMLLRGIGWTRETVAQVETTNRRHRPDRGHRRGRLPRRAPGPPGRHRGRLGGRGRQPIGRAAYLAAAIAGTAGDVFPPESYAAPSWLGRAGRRPARGRGAAPATDPGPDRPRASPSAGAAREGRPSTGRVRRRP